MCFISFLSLTCGCLRSFLYSFSLWFTILSYHFRWPYTCCTWTFLLQNKSQVPSYRGNFLKMIKTHFSTIPHIIISNNGAKFMSYNCKSIFHDLRIIHQKTMTYTSQQNRRVERKQWHLLEIARSLRLFANLPKHFWRECILIASYLINLMPMSKLDWKTPFELLYHKKPSYNHLRIMGCLCFIWATYPSCDKVDHKRIKCVFSRYLHGQKGYKVYNITSKKIIGIRDIVFHEHSFPFAQSTLDLHFTLQ